MRISGDVLTTVPSTVSPTSSPSSSAVAITASEGPPYDTNASSPEIDTIWPFSRSPCSGVLKFRLASNASAKLFASAFSLDCVMGLLLPFDGCAWLGWEAYLIRTLDASERASVQRPLHVVSSGQRATRFPCCPLSAVCCLIDPPHAPRPRRRPRPRRSAARSGRHRGAER